MNVRIGTRILSLASLMALLGACTTVPSSNIRQPLTAQPQPRPMAQVNGGAIFQPTGSQPRGPMVLFEDRRARYVGDTLTVLLVEKTSATRKSETADNRKASADIDVPGPTLLGARRGIGATSWGASGDIKQDFKDNDTNSNAISGAISVTVTEVLPNGNLRVAGEKQIAVNHDTEYIRLAGVVNPTLITAANTVNSTQLADVQIESKNAEGLDASHLASMMARFFLTLMPF